MQMYPKNQVLHNVSIVIYSFYNLICSNHNSICQ